MINPMRFVVLLLLLPVHSGRAAEDTNGVNAARLYGPVFSNVSAWAAAHPGYGRLPVTNVSSPEAAAAYDDLQPHLAGLQAAGEHANYCDWGTRYEDVIADRLPHISPAIQSIQAALWAAHYAVSNNLPPFAEHALEAMRIGRNVGEDRMLVDLLVQIAGEVPAAELLLQNLDRLDEKQLAEMDAKLQALPPGATLVEVVQMGKAVFVDNLIRQLLDAMRHADTNLFEVSYGESGAVSDEMRGTNAMGGSDAGANRSWLTENLRMAAMVEFGSGSRIGFETLNGDSFFISLGRPQRGIELLSMDYGREEAVIARGAEVALVKLKSREITPLRLRLRWPPGVRGEEVNPAQNLVLAFFQSVEAFGDESFKAALLRDPDGAADRFLELLNTTSAEYAEWINAYQRLPPETFGSWHSNFLAHATLLTRSAFPGVEQVIEEERGLIESRERLTTAIRERFSPDRGENGRAVAPREVHVRGQRVSPD